MSAAILAVVVARKVGVPAVERGTIVSQRTPGWGDRLVEAHTALRGFVAAARAAPSSDAAPSLAEQLRVHCQTVCVYLYGHHTTEDDAFLPHLAEVKPQLGPAIERLRREHVGVDRILRDLDALVDADEAAESGSSSTVWPPSWTRTSPATVTSGVDPADAGAATGLMNTTKQFGGAVGLAVLLTIASATTDPLAVGYSRVFLAVAVLLVAVAVLAHTLPPHRDRPVAT